MLLRRCSVYGALYTLWNRVEVLAISAVLSLLHVSCHRICVQLIYACSIVSSSSGANAALKDNICVDVCPVVLHAWDDGLPIESCHCYSQSVLGACANLNG